ncbi:MAG: inositol monophosphatase [Planctomycetes bacterium]|nr:inositol monophosphatase [Planctomycetota bacterium]
MFEFKDFLQSIAKRAGDALLSHYGKIGSDQIRIKEGVRDIVTTADTESEKLIIDAIKKEFPRDKIIAEETAANDLRVDGRTWIIDPLDGTVNFSRRHPLFCVSIAVYDEGGPIAGTIFAPVIGERYFAERGKGAFRGEERIRVTDEERISHALLATGFAYKRTVNPRNNLDNFIVLNLKSRGVRRGGSAALDLAHTAAGVFDGFWELYLSPWDVAAGALLVLEAGGKVTTFDGSEGGWLFGCEILATNGRLHEGISAHLDRGGF